jgi:ATP-binding cassette subfamily B (MDR/TAP) protein 1
MKDGVNIENGTHGDLINRGEMYHSMVGAQRLEPLEPLEPPEKEDDFDDVLLPKEEIEPQGSIHEIEEEEELQAARGPKEFGFFHSFCIIAREHQTHWILYILIIVGAIGAGCKYCIPLLQTSN